MTNKIFIGGAWPYANNDLHPGHLAALLPGDLIARYFRAKGSEVIYVSGTDAHGTPITKRAREERKSPHDIAEKYHIEFKNIFEKMNFSYDYYGVTYEKSHVEMVKNLIKKINNNGFLKQEIKKQDYCEVCEKFLNDREYLGTCPECGEITTGEQCDHCLTVLDTEEIKDKSCVVCGTKTVEKYNKELVFKLTEFEEIIEKNMQDNIHHWKVNAINETRKYLNEGLRDRVISRDLDWGIDLPFEGMEGKKLYVWVDAVLGYLTTCNHVTKKRYDNEFSDFLKKDSSLQTYYIHGKDNIVFHSIIFPALLAALNKNIQLPQYIISSEYLNTANEKISKSKGNYTPIAHLVDQYSSDSLRFYFMYVYPEYKDTNFSEESLIEIHNKYLVGGFGNFVNRNLAFIKKKYNGVLPNEKIEENILLRVKNAYSDLGKKLENGQIREYINGVVSFINFANKYYDENKPWELSKKDPKRFNEVTSNCLYLMANMVNLFAPVIPNACKDLNTILNVKCEEWKPTTYDSSNSVEELQLLFQKIE
jgi:methionyl-tRNA synthetase